MFLGAPYVASPYRSFASRLLQAILNGIILHLPHSLTKRCGRTLPLSNAVPLRPTVEPRVAEAIFHNALRYWANYAVMAPESLTTWGQEWLSCAIGLLAPPTKPPWEVWDRALTSWIHELHQKYWSITWADQSISHEQRVAFWATLWRIFERQVGATPSADEAVFPLFEDLASEDLRGPELLQSVPDRLRKLCSATGISWTTVPVWATEHPLLFELMPGHQAQWELPYHVLTHITGIGYREEDLDAFIARSEGERALLIAIEHATQQQREWELWVPLSDRYSTDPGEVAFSPDASIVAITEDTATWLNAHAGVGPVPDARRGQLFIRYITRALSHWEAYDRARGEMERILSSLRVADTRFVYELAHYFYWTFVEWPATLPPSGERPVMTEWRDPYRLRMPLSIEYIQGVKTWVQGLERDSRQLARALRESLRWEGMAYAQNDPVTRYYCWWSALETLGNGSFHCKELVPLELVALCHTGLRTSVDPSRQWQVFYQALDRFRSLVDELADLRNKAVMHTGRWPKDVDQPYALATIQEVVTHLNRAIATLLRQHAELSTFDDLRRILNPAFAEIGLAPEDQP